MLIAYKFDFIIDSIIENIIFVCHCFWTDNPPPSPSKILAASHSSSINQEPSTSCQGFCTTNPLTSNSIAELIHKTHYLDFCQGKCIKLSRFSFDFWLTSVYMYAHTYIRLYAVCTFLFTDMGCRPLFQFRRPPLFRRGKSGRVFRLFSGSTYWNITNVWLPLGFRMEQERQPWTDPESESESKTKPKAKAKAKRTKDWCARS